MEPSRIEWLNYHHLLYFYTVAREGSVVRAARILRLAQPTVSGQLRVLEEALGERLFERRGRGLVLTEVGNLVYRYADEIFSLGRELQDSLKGRPVRGRPLQLRVGIADVLPKLITHRLLEPALSMADDVRLVCREDEPAALMGALATHDLDLVIADAPSGPEVSAKVFNHLLGETTVTVFGAASLAARHGRAFPAGLDGAPFLLPEGSTVLRRALDQWFDARGVRPRVVAEIDDSALVKVFGQSGHGLFVAATVIGDEVRRQYDVVALGEIGDVRERFYAISVERRIKNPAVKLITERARADLFHRS
jgi:LysR family transcriptional activator of nhaA